MGNDDKVKNAAEEAKGKAEKTQADVKQAGEKAKDALKD